MSQHPYQRQPARAFWSKAVAQGFDAADVVTCDGPLLRRDDRIMSVGSCFAANLIPTLEREGFQYLRTEAPHPSFRAMPEAFGYDTFTAAYGNVYTARQLHQLVLRCLGERTPAEDRWHVDPFVVDPFRPGLKFKARSDREFDRLATQHLAATRAGFEQATVLILTLGLTEAWESVDDGSVYPACPGTVAGTFDPARHRFRNFGVAEIAADLEATIDRLRALNPALRVVVTVSPVPLVATATEQHVLAATVLSKSVLRVAAEMLASSRERVTYFPAYELVTGPQAGADAFEEDRRSVSKAAIERVMAALIAGCDVGGDRAAPVAPSAAPSVGEALSAAITEAECEEAMADVHRT